MSIPLSEEDHGGYICPLFIIYIPVTHTLFFHIRTSSFGTEAKRSYFLFFYLFIFRFEPENVLYVFLKLKNVPKYYQNTVLSSFYLYLYSSRKKKG